VPIEIRYVEKDEKGREQYTYSPSDLGAVAGIDCMDLAHMRDIGNRLREARTAAEDAKPSNQQSERTLRTWADSLDQLDRCEAELEDAFTELKAFTKPENLKLLCWLVRRNDEQDAIIQAVLEHVTGKRVTRSDVEATKRKWSAEIRTANGNRDFRVP
jgi:O6-methylguanine-DNA--protein-cysteine methyltransferase